MKVIFENHESNLTYEQQLFALMTSSNVDPAQQPRIKKPIPRPVVVNKPEEKEKSISVTNIPTQHVPVNEPLTPTSADKADKKDRSKKPKLDALKKSKRSDKGDGDKPSARGERVLSYFVCFYFANSIRPPTVNLPEHLEMKRLLTLRRLNQKQETRKPKHLPEVDSLKDSKKAAKVAEHNSARTFIFCSLI